MKFNKILFSLLFICSSFHAKAEHPIIDSLINMLNQSTELDSNTVDLFNQISYEYHRVDLDKTKLYAEKAINLAKELNFKTGESRGWNLLAVNEILTGNYELGVEHNNVALSIAEEIDSPYHKSLCYNLFGVVYSNQSDNANAIKNYLLALPNAEITKDTFLQVVVLGNLGYIHLEEGNYENAEKYLLRLMDLGNKKGDDKVIANAKWRLGYLKMEQKEFAEANRYLNEAKVNTKKIQDKYLGGTLEIHLGEIREAQFMFEKAEEHYLEALNLFRQIDARERELHAFSKLTNLFNLKDESDKAITYANLGIKKSYELNNNDFLIEYYNALHTAYANIGEHKMAYDYLNKFVVFQDSLAQHEKSKKILELETEYQLKQKEQENLLLKQVAQKNLDIIKQQKFSTTAILFILFLMTMLATLFYKNNQRRKHFNADLQREVDERTSDLITTNNKLQVSTGELERFAFITSHDLKEPLRNINGFAHLINKEIKQYKNKKLDNYLQFVIKNSRHMHSLVDGIMNYTGITKEESLEKLDLNELVENVLQFLEELIKEKNGKVEFGVLPIIEANSVKVFQIFKNLIENSIRYNDSDTPNVRIEYLNNNAQHIFRIYDNGIGIEEEYLQRVFMMFNRLHNREDYPGVGLGLSIVKKILDSMNGEIKLTSKAGLGSVFEFSFPMEGKKKIETSESVLASK